MILILKRARLIVILASSFVAALPVFSAELDDAAKKGDLNRIKAILEVAPELVSSPDPDGRSPLHHAAMSGNKDMVVFLLGKGALVNAKDRDSTLPIHLSANAEITTLFIEAKADVNARNINGFSPLHFAARKPAMVKVLLAHGASLAAKDSHGRTPLHGAVNYKASAEMLLDAGADPNAKDDYGETPLHEAARGLDPSVVDLLLEKGALLGAADSRGETPLHKAVWAGNEAVVKLLLKHKADVNAADKKGGTPLHLATRRRPTERGAKEIMKLLLAAGANVNAKTADGIIPLHHAAKNGDTDVMLLLRQSGSKRDLSSEIQSAIKEGDLGRVKSLLAEDPSLLGVKDELGNTLLHKALDARQLEIMRLLIQQKVDVNAKNTFGASVLKGAYYWPEATKMLLAAGAETAGALPIAAANGCAPVTAMLLAAGANPNEVSGGESPLISAAAKGSVEVVRILLEAGARKDDTDSNRGYYGGSQEVDRLNFGTAMMHAARGGHSNVVEILVKSGANCGAKDYWGNTALSIAKARKNEAIVQILEKAMVTNQPSIKP